MNRMERARRDYRPDEVRVLFIGESPPEGGTFFYFGDSLLHDATRDAFRQAWPALRHEHFLLAFRQLGCFVEDLSTTPVNRLPDDEAEGLLCAGIPKLARRIEPLQPRAVVIVKSSIVPKVTYAVKRAGHSDVERHELPFPTYHRQRYVRELSALVKRWRRRDVLIPLSPDGG
jgi:hypothetical protein